MGGELTAHFDTATNNYVLTLTHYRDTIGIPLSSSASLYIWSYDPVNSSWSAFQNVNAPLDTALSTSLIPNFPYGVEVGVYRDTITLPAGQYRILNTTCCRNGAIVNLAQPLSENMVLYTDLTVGNNNSTPGFLAMPVTYFPVNQPATYNPLPFDPDGDSLAWALNIPIGYGGSTSAMALDTVAGFTTPPGDPSGPFTMNSMTGEITWTPDTIGNYVQSFEVNEYHNGVQVGKIIRDMQYIVIPGGSNVSPYFQNVSPYLTNAGAGYNYIYYQPGNQLVFEIKGADVNPNTQLEMEAYSSTFAMVNPATFTTQQSGNDIIGTFSWTPPAGFTQDVITVFRVRDGQFSNDFTLMMKLGSTSVTEVNTSVKDCQVFPNPSQGKLNVALELNRDSQTEIQLLNIHGQKVASVYEGKLMRGSNLLSADLTLSSGLYYLTVSQDGAVVKTITVAIQ